MGALTKNVVRQALIEYVDARAPHILEYDDPNEEVVRNELAEYVNTRYAGHTEAFKDQQMNRIAPRVLAAIAEIQRMKEE